VAGSASAPAPGASVYSLISATQFMVWIYVYSVCANGCVIEYIRVYMLAYVHVYMFSKEACWCAMYCDALQIEHALFFWWERLPVCMPAPYLVTHWILSRRYLARWLTKLPCRRLLIQASR